MRYICSLVSDLFGVLNKTCTLRYPGDIFQCSLDNKKTPAKCAIMIFILFFNFFLSKNCMLSGIIMINLRYGSVARGISRRLADM